MYKRVVYEIELHHKKQTEVYTKHLYTKNIYSDKDEGTEVETLSLDDVYDRFHYTTVSSGWFNKWIHNVSELQTGEKFCEFWVDDGFSVSIHKNNLVSFRVVTTYENDTIKSIIKSDTSFTNERIVKYNIFSRIIFVVSIIFNSPLVIILLIKSII